MAVVRAPGLAPDGRIGVRGYRGFCKRCLWLSAVRPGYGGARYAYSKHECATISPVAGTASLG